MSVTLSIIDRYIAREIILSSLMTLGVLMLIMLSSEVVFLLRYVAEGQIPADRFMHFYLNSGMKYFITLIPLSLFMGVMIAFGRLYNDSEMAALLSSGVSMMRLNRPLLIVVLPASIALLLLQLFASPWVYAQRDALKEEIETRSEMSLFAPGRFNQSSNGRSIFFMEKSGQGGRMDGVFHRVYDGEKEVVDVATTAERSEDDAGRAFSVMRDGVQYSGMPGTSEYHIIRYGAYGVLLPDKSYDHIDTRSRSVRELWEGGYRSWMAELHWRITVPIAGFISAFIALPLSKTSPRSGRFSKLVVALLVYLIYSNMLGVSRTWMTNGVVPFWISSWWVHVVAIAFLLYLWQRYDFMRWGHRK